MSKNVIKASERFRAASRHGFKRTPPELKQRTLSRAYLRELINSPSPWNLLAVFADANYGAFLEYAAAEHPELFRQWVWNAMKESSQLRRIVAEAERQKRKSRDGKIRRG